MSDDKYDDLTDSLLDAVPAHDPGTDSESDPTGSDPSPLDALLSSLPSDAREVVRRLAVDHQLPADDPLWAYIGVTGSIQTLLERAERAAEAQREQIIGAARAEIERTREEASGAIAESLAEAQKTLAAAAAREVAAMETSARTAVGQVVEDLRRRGAEAVEEVRRSSPAHRTIWQRIWPPILSLTTAIAVGVGVGAGAHLLAAPPYLAPLIIDHHGDIYAVPQGQTLAKDKDGNLFAHVAPVKIQPLRRQE